MANPKPAQTSDYRDHIDNPRVRSRDILIWIEKRNRDVTSAAVANHFGFGVAEGAARLSGLKKWGCMCIITRGKGNQPNIWEITPWGVKMAEKWGKE